MQFALTEEQQMLKDSVRAFLADRMPMTRVRELMESPTGFDPAVWSEMAGMGWQAMAIPEEYGGAGYSFRELGVLMEEMGRALTPVPFLSTVVLGATAILLGGTTEQRAAYLPRVAEGDLLLAWAVTEPGRGWEQADLATTARREGDDVVLDGAKGYVIDGHVADVLVVAATDDDGGVGLYLVPSDAPGVVATPLVTLDLTRTLAEVTLSGVRVPASARLEAAGRELIEQVERLAVVAVASEQVGGTERCLEMAVEYAKDRHQFGRPIGSFQAIKHTCADMLVHLESAKSAASYAAWAAAEDDPDLAVAAALAKSRCSDAYFAVAGDTIQVHGGIGFTWEHDAHLYFKRAKSDELLFGDPARWRGKLAAALGMEP